MRRVAEVVGELAVKLPRIDVLVHAVGVLLPRAEHTDEGIEKDLAVSYLSRFAFLEDAAAAGLLHSGTALVNVSAAAPRVPSYARMEFSSLEQVRARTGMTSHGQAQLANDLLTVQAPQRYGVRAVGYGPGSVRTQIRREVPAAARVALAPFFALRTRRPEAVAEQLVGILEGELPQGRAVWFGRRGAFDASPYVTDARRQADLLRVSLALLEQARGG